jgi:lysophospholipase L1-like esterase
MYKKFKWTAILTISAATAAILIIGFVSSVFVTSTSSVKSAFKIDDNKQMSNDTKKEDKMKEENTKSYNILVMGDSLAKGTGDEKGKGFAGSFADLWKTKETKPINVTNIAVNGDTSSGLLNIVNDQETLKYIENSKIILISIGGNEIKNFASLNSASTSSDNSVVKSTQDKYFSNLKTIFKTIRSKNSKCMVIFIGLYNPLGKNITSDEINLLDNWNYETNEIVSSDSNSIFIPTYDLFKYNVDNYLAPDNFHPNGTGYDAISKRIFEALNNYKD